jgi:hypothetical protein
MSKPNEFLRYAEECERLARAAPPDTRETLLAIARAWRVYAQRGDKTLDQAPSADGD